MKILVDSSGWIEYFLNGPNAERYSGVIKKLQDIVTPSIVIYEVYKIIKREINQELALSAVEILQKTHVVDLTLESACEAADISLDSNLSMGDAIIYAISRKYNVPLYTSDADFKKLPKVEYIPTEE